MFRPDKSHAVSRGKWYFEFEAVTAGEMRVGWARPSCTPGKELGSDDRAFVFNGFEVRCGQLLHRCCSCCSCMLLKSQSAQTRLVVVLQTQEQI